MLFRSIDEPGTGVALGGEPAVNVEDELLEDGAWYHEEEEIGRASCRERV